MSSAPNVNKMFQMTSCSRKFVAIFTLTLLQNIMPENWTYITTLGENLPVK
jgi:hypothetical protein